MKKNLLVILVLIVLVIHSCENNKWIGDSWNPNWRRGYRYGYDKAKCKFKCSAKDTIAVSVIH